jgi:hypothetical protein
MVDTAVVPSCHALHLPPRLNHSSHAAAAADVAAAVALVSFAAAVVYICALQTAAVTLCC